MPAAPPGVTPLARPDPGPAADVVRPAPAGGFPGWAGVLLVAAQLGLILVAVHRYEFAAGNHLFAVLAVAAGGYVAHSLLPVRLRLALFGLLSAGAILFVLGLENGLSLLGIGGALVALCRLPARPLVRAALVGLAGLGLASLRLEHDWAFWPVLGSMFMFRTAVYLHDTRHAARPPLGVTLAYFFPLPNVCFPFFPILDFRTFRETYRPDAGWETSQEGVGWVAHGLAHLLLYRAVKYYVLPAPHDLGDPAKLALFLAASYALYLHVSGYFHVITGVFHLFGFRLPRTHHNYFLASSFTDIWRRINIPWKEFLAKTVFLPAYFALRGRGTGAAAVAAALGVFLATWAFHSYQVFWLAGRLPVSFDEAGLWLAAGVLVAVNLRLDLARAARGAGRPAALTPARAARHAAQVVGMFMTVCVFWAYWNTPAAVSHLRAVSFDRPGVSEGGAWIVGVLAGAVALGTAAQLASARLSRAGLLPVRVSPVAAGVGYAAALSAGAALTLPGVADLAGPAVAKVAAELRRESVTPAEAARIAQGYYEEIADARVRPGALLGELEGRPYRPPVNTYIKMSRPSDDLLVRELIPGWTGEVAGSPLTINRFGMRDRPDRTEAKPPGTCRVAVVGSSSVMGYGVRDEETSSYLLEDRLNAGSPPGGPRYEVLNFATGRSTALSRRVLIDRKVWAFSPDALYWVAHQDEVSAAVEHLARVVANGTPVPYPGLAAVVRNAGATADRSHGVAEAALQPFGREVVSAIYRDLISECRRRGVLPVLIYVPVAGVVRSVGKPEVVGLAEEAGFTVLNLSDWAGGRPPVDVRVDGDVVHVNATGHRLVADQFEQALARRPELLPCGRPGRPPVPPEGDR